MKLSWSLLVEHPVKVGAATGLLVVGYLIILFRPNGDVAAFIQHPATAAWLQAVGSVGAILLAIWIDKRAGDRLVIAEQRAHAESVTDWRAALADSVRRATTLANEAQLNQQYDGVRAAQTAAYLANISAMLEIYLRQPPPNPFLAMALLAARRVVDATEMRITRAVDVGILSDFSGVIRPMVLDVQTKLIEIQRQYEAGIL